jgi:Flp pilus assembly protein TadD
MFHNNLGSAYLERGELPLAKEQFEKAVALQPEEMGYQGNLEHCQELMDE